MSNETAARLSSKIDEQETQVRLWQERYAGNAPLTFLSPESKKSLGDRLSRLSVNFCRLAVDALVERLRVTGFMIDGKADADLWERWRAQAGSVALSMALTDSLSTGTGWLSVWAVNGSPKVTGERADSCAIERDPFTGETVSGMKRWTAEGLAHGVLYEPDRLALMRSISHVPEGGTIPADGWQTLKEIPNPLGVVPLIPLINRTSGVNDLRGTSEMSLIADLNDALTKALVDAMVTSEAYARPRRHVAGLTVQEDEDGNPIDPFADPTLKAWIAEEPDTKFGQFPAADLKAYDSLTDTLLSQISALSGLPSHYVFSKMSPSNGEEVRAKEISLVARAESKVLNFTPAVADVARLMVAIRDNSAPQRIKAEPVWADAASRTIAQEADAVVKLAQGDNPVLPMRQARQKLGYSLTEIQEMERQEAAERAQRIADGLTTPPGEVA